MIDDITHTTMWTPFRRLFWQNWYILVLMFDLPKPRPQSLYNLPEPEEGVIYRKCILVSRPIRVVVFFTLFSSLFSANILGNYWVMMVSQVLSVGSIIYACSVPYELYMNTDKTSFDRFEFSSQHPGGVSTINAEELFYNRQLKEVPSFSKKLFRLDLTETKV
jgi:hypothetical protein